jgi:hypothetical protein
MHWSLIPGMCIRALLATMRYAFILAATHNHSFQFVQAYRPRRSSSCILWSFSLPVTSQLTFHSNMDNLSISLECYFIGAFSSSWMHQDCATNSLYITYGCGVTILRDDVVRIINSKLSLCCTPVSRPSKQVRLYAILWMQKHITPNYNT